MYFTNLLPAKSALLLLGEFVLVYVFNCERRTKSFHPGNSNFFLRINNRAEHE
jgi:hypothetical protein